MIPRLRETNREAQIKKNLDKQFFKFLQSYSNSRFFFFI